MIFQRFSSSILLLLLASTSTAFTIPKPNSISCSSTSTTSTSTSTSTQLNAIGVLARKAKEADVRAYCEGGVDDKVMEQVQIMKTNLPTLPTNEEVVGPLQSCLTKRKGTVSIIAEYKRKFAVESGFVDEVFEPDILSPIYREYGAMALSVLADERIGGCTYDDIEKVVKEQQSAKGEVPGPMPVISNDLIVDEVQIARSAASGANSVVVNLSVVGVEKTELFIQCAKALNMETIVSVSNQEEAQKAVDVGGRMIMVPPLEDMDERYGIVSSLNIPDGAQVCTISNISTNDNKALEEVEEVWVCRDRGFNAVWVGDVLYKAGSDVAEHAGKIIKSMAAKSSVKWATPKALGGKGEGAREYLGDIMM